MNRLSKKITHEIKNRKNIVSNTKFSKNIKKNFVFILTKFSNITGMTILSAIEFHSNMLLLIRSGLRIVSKTNFNTTFEFLLKKNIVLYSRVYFKSSLNLKVKKVMWILSTIESTVGYETTLRTLDSLKLDELDMNTLEELNFSNGVSMVLLKKIEIFSNFESTATLDIKGYAYNILNSLDNLTLDLMDMNKLTELDRTEV